MSLYRYYYEDTNYFGFVDSEGKEVIMPDDKLNSDLRTYNHKLQERRQKVQEVNALMRHDNTIANRLWKMDMSSDSDLQTLRCLRNRFCSRKARDGDVAKRLLSDAETYTTGSTVTCVLRAMA